MLVWTGHAVSDAGMAQTTAEQQLRESIGARVAQLREARNVTQEQLAERVNAAPQTIRRIERGKTTPPLGRLLDIAAALGVQLLDLFDGADAAVPPPSWDTDEATVVELWRATPGELRPMMVEVMRSFAARR